MTTPDQPARRAVRLPRELSGLEIVRWAHGGDGVAFADGKIVFVPRVVPGDIVDVVVVQDAERWARARVVSVVRPSPERVEPPCAVQATCGGCPWMIGTAAVQAASREAILRGEVMKRLGAGVEVALAATGASLGYRQRVRLTWRGDQLGYLEKGTHTLIDIGAACPIADPTIGAVLPELAATLRARGGAGRVTLLAGDEGVAGWIVPDDAPGEVWGAPAVTVAMGQHAQVMRASGFAQANAQVTADIVSQLTRIFADEVTTGHALELFAGSGTLTQALWDAGWTVTAYELDGRAREAFEATRLASHGVGTWHVCDLSTGLVHPSPPPVDAVLLDPPRTGAAAVMPWIRASAARLVVYVSCDLATGLRDLATLCSDGRWAVTHVTGYDMFPHSGHQEVVAVARRLP